MTLKTKLIQTGKATILVVDLPKGAKLFSNLVCGQSAYWLNDNPKFYKLPEGNWKILGFADQLTEEQAIEVVDKYGGHLFDGDMATYHQYPDYLSIDHPFNPKTFYTALDSFNSLLKANGIVTVNHIEKPVPKQNQDYSVYEMALGHWQQAESELWVNPAILLKQ